MKRRAVQFVFAVSLLLTLALSVLWARSLRVDDSFSVQRSWVIENDVVAIEYAGFGTASGSLHAGWGRGEKLPAVRIAPTPREAAPWTFRHIANSRAPFRSDPSRPWWIRLGFYCHVGDRWTDRSTISVPMWLAVAPPLFVVSRMFRRFVRDRRRRDRLAGGACLECGYDLRGARHVRCPECGTAIERAHATDAATSVRHGGPEL